MFYVKTLEWFCLQILATWCWSLKTNIYHVRVSFTLSEKLDEVWLEGLVNIDRAGRLLPAQPLQKLSQYAKHGHSFTLICLWSRLPPTAGRLLQDDSWAHAKLALIYPPLLRGHMTTVCLWSLAMWPELIKRSAFLISFCATGWPRCGKCPSRWPRTGAPPLTNPARTLQP